MANTWHGDTADHPTTYSVDLAALDVIADQGSRGRFSMNGGEPCTTADELRDFIRTLHTEGAFDAATRDALLADCAGADREEE